MNIKIQYKKIMDMKEKFNLKKVKNIKNLNRDIYKIEFKREMRIM